VTLETIIGSLIVKPHKEPIFSEQATIIALEDEAAGPYVTVSQSHEHPKIGFMADEWPAIKEAIERMLEVCAEQEVKP